MSQLEGLLIEQIADAGLPAPKTEFRFAPPRRWKFDLCWDFYRLAVEVEGGTWILGRHSRGKGYEQDCEKYARATIQGWRVIRVTGNMVRDGRALLYIREAMCAFRTGWRCIGETGARKLNDGSEK